MSHIRILVLSLFIAALSACSSMAPQYTASIDNVQKLKDTGSSNARVGDFQAASDASNATSLQIRASSMKSPYDGSYAKYVQAALTQELTIASKLAPNADVEISGILLKNELDAAMSTGSADITVRFIVKKSGQIRYDAVKSAHHEWPSSFVGAIAIPRAVQEYPGVIQALLAALYSDPAFLQALK
jgi:hypothetical protein